MKIHVHNMRMYYMYSVEHRNKSLNYFKAHHLNKCYSRCPLKSTIHVSHLSHSKASNQIIQNAIRQPSMFSMLR